MSINEVKKTEYDAILASKTLIEVVRDIAPTEKASIKGYAISKAIQQGVYEVNKGLTIEIVSTEPIEGGIQVFARAWQDGEQIGFGADGTVDIERFRCFNPPILIPDINGNIIREIQAKPEENIEYSIQKYTENPQQALLQHLSRAIDMMQNKHDGSVIIAGKTGNTTSTFNPSLDGNASRVGVDESWATIRAGAGNASDTVATSDEVGIRVSLASATRWRNFNRLGFVLDTSGLPDGDTISSANFQAYVTSVTNTIVPSSGTMGFGLIDFTPASDASFANSDYGNFGTTRYASDILIGSLTTSAFNTWTFNATGIAAISKTGNTRFGFRHSRDIDNSEPTGSHSTGQNSRFFMNMVDNASNDPVLTVEHAAASSASSSPSTSPSTSASTSPSSSPSTSPSTSASTSPSSSPSTSPSSSPSTSSSTSPSSSPSPSNSPSSSASNSPSTSPSTSTSSSPSSSPSPSNSPSTSPSDSPSSSPSPSSSVSSSVSNSPSSSISTSTSSSPSVSISFSPSSSPSTPATGILKYWDGGNWTPVN